MNYIAVDIHISTLDFAVVNEKGKISKEQRIPTSAKGFMEFISNVPKTRQIIIEEDPLAAWILEICTKYKEKLIITDPKINRWIGLSKDKDDDIDARKLAHLARGGYIKEIYHPVGERRRFKELISVYHDTVKSETRIKNKLKSKFRQNGIQCTGEKVYLKNHRDSWKAKLPKDKIVNLIVSGLWDQLD